MRKPAILHCKKVQISCSVIVQLISAVVFAIQIVQSNYLLNPKFQASGHPLWLHSLVCVGPGRKPRSMFFPQRGSLGSWSLLSLHIDSTIYLIHESNISSLLQCSIDVQRDLCLNWSRIPKTDFYGLAICHGQNKRGIFFSF